MLAVRIHAPGGPDAMQLDDVSVGTPGKGEVLLKQTAAGLNYIDVYHRTGLYPLKYPAIIGTEAVGIIEAVGEGVVNFRSGDRAGYVSPVGAYAAQRVIAADKLIPIPPWLTDDMAAAVLLQGMTAHYLVNDTFRLRHDHVVLLHAAAGGVGQLLSQWAAHIGATVIGTVGSAKKANIAKQKGCHFVINYNEQDFAKQVDAITKGAGVDVVYDSVGKTTFEGSLACLKQRGTMVSFGQASGPVPPMELTKLAGKSLYLTRPKLGDYTVKRDDLLKRAANLFLVMKSGGVKVAAPTVYALKDVAAAHRALEGRATTGKIVLKI